MTALYVRKLKWRKIYSIPKAKCHKKTREKMSFETMQKFTECRETISSRYFIRNCRVHIR